MGVGKAGHVHSVGNVGLYMYMCNQGMGWVWPQAGIDLASGWEEGKETMEAKHDV